MLSTPNYDALAAQAVHGIGGGRTVFAGQRLEGFYVDLGSVFDLGNLRPFQNLHVLGGSLQAMSGVNGTNDFSVHSIALKVPKQDLTRRGVRSDRSELVWRRSSACGRRPAGSPRWSTTGTGATSTRPARGSRSRAWATRCSTRCWWGWASRTCGTPRRRRPTSGSPPASQHPELATLLPALYPGVFPNLAKYTAPRADLVAILLTGIPSGIIPGFQNFTGKTLADMLRLNLAIPPASNPSALGILGGDLAGFPNGRRVFDDVVSVELRAIAGLTIPLVDKTFTPDAAASVVTDGLTQANTRYLSQFPYLGTPQGGYQTAPLGAL